MMLPGADPSGRSPGCEQPRAGDEEPAEGHNLRVSQGCSHCIRLMANGGHVSPGGGGDGGPGQGAEFRAIRLSAALRERNSGARGLRSKEDRPPFPLRRSPRFRWRGTMIGTRRREQQSGSR